MGSLRFLTLFLVGGMASNLVGALSLAGVLRPINVASAAAERA